MRTENGAELDWSGLEFSASWQLEMYGDTYENWVRGAVNEAGDSVVWIETGERKIRPADAQDDWHPDEFSWRAERIPLVMQPRGPTRTRWVGKLEGADALSRLISFREYVEKRQPGWHGGHTVRITERIWPGDRDPEVLYLQLELFEIRD